jgi:hypothetical protein
MLIEDFLNTIKTDPKSIAFEDTLSVIESNYDFIETEFTNGKQKNKAGENSGSCKVFAFALKQKLSKEHTLSLFAQYYYNDVLENTEGTDHQNIRQFMINGFKGINFNSEALTEK